jgi:hypothetical protein
MSQRPLEFGGQITVDLETDADFDKDRGSPGHRFPPLRLRLRWTVGQLIQLVSNEMLRRSRAATARPPKGSLRPFANFEAAEASR